MRKVSVKKTYTKVPCYCCNEGAHGTAVKKCDCKACDGKGNYTEYHYIMTVDNIAFDMDTLK